MLIARSRAGIPDGIHRLHRKEGHIVMCNARLGTALCIHSFIH